MLELLDSGRLAYKLGKWRGLLHMAYAVPLVLLAFAIANMFTVLPGSPLPPIALQWICYGLLGVAAFLWLYGIYRVYRDHNSSDVYLEADRYKREGW